VSSLEFGPSGQCPVCTRVVELNADGSGLSEHYDFSGYITDPCPGSAGPAARSSFAPTAEATPPDWAVALEARIGARLDELVARVLDAGDEDAGAG
jgi:hypothetical protein